MQQCRQQQEPTEATQVRLNAALERCRNLRPSGRGGCQNNNAENSENSGEGNSGGGNNAPLAESQPDDTTGDAETFESLVQQAGDEAEHAADITGFNQAATGSATTQGGIGDDPASSSDVGLTDPVFADASGFSTPEDTQQPDMIIL